jgi:PhzF family phenazine biosynthesis protein
VVQVRGDGLELEWWVSFADGPGGGNPAPIVIAGATLGTARMQKIAATLGFETVFVQPDITSTFGLRYFVPRHEVEMCGHATVAAISLLRERGAVRRSGSFGTVAGERAYRSEDNGDVMIELDQPRFAPRSPTEDQVAAVLGIDRRKIAGPLSTVSVARAKTIVPLVDESTLDQLQPNHTQLWELCERHDSTGIYAFAPSTDGRCDFAARQFPLRVGFVEDPATGIAAGALAAYLDSRGIAPRSTTSGYRIGQGRAMRQPSVMRAHVPHDTAGCVWIGGRATRADQPATR